MKNAKDNRRQTSAAMERYSALHRRPCSRYLDLQPQQRLNLQAQGEEGKLIGRHHRERNASVFDFLWWYKLHKLDHSSHQSKSSVNVDRLTSNVSASVKHRYQFNFDFAVDESHQKRTSSRTSTRLQSRQRRLHV